MQHAGPDTFKATTVQRTSVETIGAFVRGKLEFDSVLGADSAWSISDKV